MLAKIVASNDDSAYPKLKHSLFTLLTRQLITQLGSSLKSENYSVVVGILNFFSCMDSKSIQIYLYEVVMEFVSLIEEGHLSLNKTKSKENHFCSSVLLEPFLVVS